jgi:hypothetical protein
VVFGCKILTTAKAMHKIAQGFTPGNQGLCKHVRGYLIVKGFTPKNLAAGIQFPTLIVEGFTLKNWAAGIQFLSNVHLEIDLERGKS